MFSKRYVGPANCASCEKNIVNLLGQPVDYHVWKRLPFREPSERIARVSIPRVLRFIFTNTCPHVCSVRTRLFKDSHHDEAFRELRPDPS